MDAIDRQKTSNLWFGFALGMTASGIIAYLLGTRKGRERLKKLIEFAEKTNVDDYLERIIDRFDDGFSKEKKEINSGLDNLIDKIQSFSTKRG
jgi:IS1 family transposase